MTAPGRDPGPAGAPGWVSGTPNRGSHHAGVRPHVAVPGKEALPLADPPALHADATAGTLPSGKLVITVADA
ncbi:hypothetical protein GCM10027605_02780 [Micromonospora zhanjiangensis]